ncbi:MAG: DUF4388 domain-containing protein [Cyanobacteria bacterium CRU_2_1]|nr:DUF4388 domain-containing protein [Cyanobacteria bacterium RU_5_0]NJR60550.1 DUF4388 domain-containing protein [Cyanobacteria bacterium CRU_2_1]
MGIAGRLSTFSLAEVLQILDRGCKTGLLTVRVSLEKRREQPYYIWFRQGQIVAAAEQLDHKELLSVLIRRGWLDYDTASLYSQVTRLDRPLGSLLKEEGVLQIDHLKSLFQAQVPRRLGGLFKFKDGEFKFDSDSPLPKLEMTGFSMPALEAALLGLRTHGKTAVLISDLPKTHSILSQAIRTRYSIKLNFLEQRVWNLANGILSVAEIAARLHQPMDVIQQVSFRLIAVGLVEEVPIMAPSAQTSMTWNGTEGDDLGGAALEVAGLSSWDSGESTVSRSFLKTLIDFLRSKL